MDKGQGQWDKLVDMPQSYEENSTIAQKAIEELSQRQKQPKKSWFFRQWKVVVACAAALLLGIGIGLPLYKKFTTPQVVYYEGHEIVYEDIENPTKFITQSKIDILYFESPLTTKSASIAKTGEFAFLEQNALYINEVGFDQIILRCVAKKNVELNFDRSYKSLNDQHTVAEIDIKYQVYERLDSGDRQILAKFSYEKVDYYLDITTEQDAIQQLEAYVNMLLGE